MNRIVQTNLPSIAFILYFLEIKAPEFLKRNLGGIY
jgi:hypothetical protein